MIELRFKLRNGCHSLTRERKLLLLLLHLREEGNRAFFPRTQLQFLLLVWLLVLTEKFGHLEVYGFYIVIVFVLSIFLAMVSQRVHDLTLPLSLFIFYFCLLFFIFLFFGHFNIP